MSETSGTKQADPLPADACRMDCPECGLTIIHRKPNPLPAERVIEVAPQGKIPGTVEWWTSDKPLVDRLHYYAAARGTAETALFVPDDILEILAMLSNSEAALTAAREERDRLSSHYSDAKELIQRMMKEEEALREERDRAREALRDMLVIAEFDRWHCASTAGRQIAFRKAEEALKPVSDRQPEGETK